MQGYRDFAQNTGIQGLCLECRNTGTLLRIQGYRISFQIMEYRISSQNIGVLGLCLEYRDTQDLFLEYRHIGDLIRMQDLFFEYRDTRTLLRSQGFRISSQNTGIQDLHLEYRDTGSPLRIQGYRLFTQNIGIQTLYLEYRLTKACQKTIFFSQLKIYLVRFYLEFLLILQNTLAHFSHVNLIQHDFFKEKISY